MESYAADEDKDNLSFGKWVTMNVRYWSILLYSSYPIKICSAYSTRAFSLYLRRSNPLLLLKHLCVLRLPDLVASWICPSTEMTGNDVKIGMLYV
jgi:hypothetical protein